MSFLDDIEVSSSHLKRFNESVINPKCFLKVVAITFCFDNNLSFSSNIIFSCMLLFSCEKYGLHAFQNGLELQSTFSRSKYCNLACLFRFVTMFHCRLNFTSHVNWIFWFISLVFETWSDHCLFLKVLIKIGFLIPS